MSDYLCVELNDLNIARADESLSSQWSNQWVVVSTALSPVFFVVFIVIEAALAREPGN